MTYRMICKKYIGKKLKEGEPSGFWWTCTANSANYHYYELEVLDSTAKERHFYSTLRFDDDRVITEIDDLRSTTLRSESLKESAFRKGIKPRSKDYEILDKSLCNCIE